MNEPTLPTTSPDGSSPNPARRVARRKRSLLARMTFALIGFIVLAGAVLGGFMMFGKGLFKTERPDLLTHKVKAELLPVTVVERGTLESAENKDVICKVKAGSKASFASTIKWVIDDGSVVTKGQLLMELDDSSLQDQLRTQSIVVEKARAEWVKADQEYVIQVKTNAALIATADAAFEVAELDLEKFVGIRPEPELIAFAAAGGIVATLVEKGEYRKNLDDVSAQLKQAQSDFESYLDRVAWANRAMKQKYITPSQAKAEESKLESSRDKVAQLTKQKFLLETFLRKKDLTDLRNKVEVARMNLDKEQRQAFSKEVQAESTRKTAFSVYQQELEKLREVEDQIRECKIVAPQDGMVVYYKPESGRFNSGSQQGMIAQGEQVKEGQKLMRIPDLKRMQVNTRVHEAMVGRIRGDERKSTGVFESLRAGLLANPDPLSRLVTHTEPLMTIYRDMVRDKEYYVATPGQTAQIKVDALPGRVLKGHVRSVAAVAAQGDWMSSDVKVYQTLVLLDESVEGLKPDMSAEVTINVDSAKEQVLAVPLQAIVGGAESGPKRKIYVKTATGTEEREIELGSFNDKMVEIRSGLQEGDEVVLNPKVLLGDKAKTREDPASQAARSKGEMGGFPGGDKKGKGGGKKGEGGMGGPPGGMNGPPGGMGGPGGGGKGMSSPQK
jgi:HlyD family secretion protein